jgi:dihydrofolate reductase
MRGEVSIPPGPFREQGEEPAWRPARTSQEEEMTRIVVTEFMSLDGVMEEPGWTFRFDRGPEGDKYKYDELFASDALLLGRVTYQGFAQAWPSMGGDDFGQRMNSIPKYVVSGTLTDAEASWGPTTVLRGDVTAEVAALKARPGGNLLVEGSSQLVQALARHGLVDEYRLMVFPIILGRGKRVFPADLADPAQLSLVDSQTAGDGVLMLTLQPAGTE